MLLRIVVLLLLCLSSAMCATLGHYQTPEQEEEAPAVDPQLTDGVVAAASEQEGVAAADAKVGDSPEIKEPGLLAKILAVDDPAADKPEVDVPVADDTAAKEPEKDSDRPAGDTPAMEAVVQQQPSEEEQEVEGNEIRPVQTDQSLDRPLVHEDSNSWGINSIRNGFQNVHGYFDSLVELVGGRNGVCEYRCRYGKSPQPRPGYQHPEPNGCSTSLVGFQIDLGIPAMTKCCNELDVCYDTCGTSKNDCDSRLRSCLHGICSDLKKSLGFVSRVQACESMADAVYNTVGTLGCRPYMNSQRAACLCEEEQKDEL